EEMGKDMGPDEQSLRGIRRLIDTVTLTGNQLGAIVIFVYFTFVHSPLELAPTARDRTIMIVYFAVMTSVLILGLFALGRRLFRPLWQDLGQGGRARAHQDLSIVAGRLMDAPLYSAGLTAMGWVLAGFIFGLQPLVVWHPNENMWSIALKTFFGCVFVGGPFTVLFVYFVLEWRLRKRLPVIFPSESLRTMPPSVRVNVLPRMLLVSLMIGILPVTIVSFLTLSQIEAIQAGKAEISSFLAHMPGVIVFLLSLAVIAAVGLSLLMAASVSDPLRRADFAMDRVRKGELDVSVPVISNDEIGIMSEGFNRMVAGLRERDAIRDTFGRYLSEEVVSEILRSPEGVNLGGELREISVLVSDLREFTPLAESLEPEIVVTIINRYLGKMTDVILRHEGTIDEFTGDGILVFFGAPRSLADHVRRAVTCGLEMQAAMDQLNEENLRLDLPQLEMGIGVNCGELVVGNIGSEKRKKYGAVGSPINVGRRPAGNTSERHRASVDCLFGGWNPNMRN
ncbi:MAG: adenylate/guanylate cyclase domain-containing protein, partial [Deltaproteobacteria bacterium]